MDKKMPVKSAKDAEHRYWLSEAMARLEYDVAWQIEKSGRIPTEWHELAVRKPGKKRKVSLEIDEDVIKFFKSLGYGYQPRMNDVLRAFMHAKLGRVLMGLDTPEGFADRAPRFRPAFGDSARDFD